MESKISSALRVTPSLCDDTSRLSIPATFGLFMDAATEHAEILRVGAKEMMAKGMFWLTVKTRVRFRRRPKLMEQVLIETWPEAPGKIRCMRDYVLRGGGDVLAEGKTEWAVIDMESGKLLPASGIYPPELVHAQETVCDGAFSRIRDDFSDAALLTRYRIVSTDIDLGGHMNNAAYVRAVIGAFTTGQLREMNISEMEVNFRAPCYEGDVLEIRARKTEQGLEVGAIRADGKAALLVLIK